MRMQFRSLAPLSGLRIWHCCEHHHELWYGSQMWLGSGVAVAVAWASSYSRIRPLAWEPPYASGVALKDKKERRKERKKKKERKTERKTERQTERKYSLSLLMIDC